jgi:redox-sensitive bicupin YhaK (pirin superfamily)
MVGPFIFLDQMGPATFRPGEAFDVRPHPHIGLSTVTYLYDGAIVHRDSLGSQETIEPGAVNLMTAGRGIVHSERTGEAERRAGFSMMGLQAWVALPRAAEERAPSFDHYDAAAMPVISGEGKTVRILMGSLYGRTSPVRTDWDTVYADIALDRGAAVPIDAEAEERALYVAAGVVDIAGDRFGEGSLLVLRPTDRITVTAVEPARFALLGGAAMDGPRHIWWNFVSSSKERIDAAKADWAAGRFEAVPGDAEFIPLPD